MDDCVLKHDRCCLLCNLKIRNKLSKIDQLVPGTALKTLGFQGPLNSNIYVKLKTQHVKHRFYCLVSLRV